MELKTINVNTAFTEIVRRIDNQTIPVVRHFSRYGDTLRIPEPFVLTYERPWECVLLNYHRDANPFFHLAEALWMLGGRQDVKPLLYFNSKMIEFSDNGETLNGAYGHRWRGMFMVDQITWITQHLRKDPNSRRAVINMWSPSVDCHMVDQSGKDVPCNTQAYFRILDGRLEMTVCNRSNDIIWGMLGANVVHFAFLQAYIAASIGVGIGRYHQISNDAHVYLANWKPKKWLDDTRGNPYTHRCDLCYIPLATCSEHLHFIDQLCRELFKDSKGYYILDGYTTGAWNCPFITGVVGPMLHAFARHKQRIYLGDHGAFRYVDRITDAVWREAAKQWISKRYNRWTNQSKEKEDGT